MFVIENAFVVSRSLGDNNVVVVEDGNTGIKFSFQNPKQIELELGSEGKVVYKEGPANQLVSFEPIMIEELV